jgi:YfiH family protein
MNSMRKTISDGLLFGQFELLLTFPALTHGTFTRHGGDSVAPFDSLNVGSSEASDPAVEENHRRIANALKIPRLIESVQEHKDQIFLMEKLYLSHKPIADILITQLKGIGLMIKHADCQAGLFYDPEEKVVANVHAGWRGCVQKVYTKAVKAMSHRFGSKPANIFACISPSLGPCHAEFKNYRTELPSSFWPYQVKPFYFDFWAIAENELLEAGLKPHHIEIARECTYANNGDYFSYRREKVTGRMGSVIALNADS